MQELQSPKERIINKLNWIERGSYLEINIWRVSSTTLDWESVVTVLGSINQKFRQSTWIL